MERRRLQNGCGQGQSSGPRNMVAVISRFLGRGEPLEEPPSDVIYLIVTAKRQERRQE